MSRSKDFVSQADTAAGIGRRKFLRRAGLVAVSGLAGAIIAGCGPANDKTAATNAANPAAATAAVLPAEQALVAAARAEGKLVLYTGSEESIIANLGKAFQAKYGVALEYLRLNSGEIAARYTAEAQAGRTVADLVLTGDHELFQHFAKQNWLAKLESESVPGLAAWPSDYRDDNTAIVSIVPYAIAINTDKIREIPRDWTILATPEFKSGIVTLDAKRVNLVAIAAWDLMLKQYGEEFLRKVGQQQLRLVDSAPSAVQQLAAGAVKAYFPCSMMQAESMISQGAPIKSVLPENMPYTGVMSQVAMSAGAAHPNAAHLFISFLMTEQGQKILNVVASSPVNTPGTPPLRPGFVKPDFASTAANRAKIIQLLGM
jgi:iron(III) transport system substrate-binding protein